MVIVEVYIHLFLEMPILRPQNKINVDHEKYTKNVDNINFIGNAVTDYILHIDTELYFIGERVESKDK